MSLIALRLRGQMTPNISAPSLFHLGCGRAKIRLKTHSLSDRGARKNKINHIERCPAATYDRDVSWLENMPDRLKNILRVDSLEYWHDVLCAKVFEGECSKADPDFRVSLWANRFEDVQVSVISSTAHTFQRREKHARHTKIDELVLTLQLTGNSIYRQDGRELTLRPGDLTCGDSTRPVKQTFIDEVSQLVVQLPRRLMLDAIGPTERYTARELSRQSSVGSMLVSFLRRLPPVLESVPSSTGAHLSDCAIGLVMTALAEPASLKLDESEWKRGALLFRAKDFIRTHFRNPDLTPTLIASFLNISVRYLQELFRDENATPSGYIWHCRLENSKLDMDNSYLTSLSIGDIAIRNGFSDLGHFGRRFRESYGMSPRDYRTFRLAQLKK